MTGNPITSGQSKQVVRFVSDAAESALKELGLDKDAAQRLIEQGDEIKAGILKLLGGLTLTNEFADEEVPSEYGYLSG